MEIITQGRIKVNNELQNSCLTKTIEIIVSED